MSPQEKLDTNIQKKNSFLCIGLDSDVSKLPLQFQNSSTPQFDFNTAIIEATHDLVIAYKPNTAFYEARGEQGIHELKLTCDYIRERHPDIFLILDAKRADIGNTNEGYATFFFDYLGADAVTLHPYLGGEALKPFLNRADKGCIILCRNSNPGSGEFQDLVFNGEPLFKHVAQKVFNEWNVNKNCFLVVGATYPKDIQEVRALCGDMTLLIPGIGAQGGDLEQTIQAGLNSQKAGIIINSSRAILFASSGKDFAIRAREEALQLRDEINSFRI